MNLSKLKVNYILAASLIAAPVFFSSAAYAEDLTDQEESIELDDSQTPSQEEADPSQLLKEEIDPAIEKIGPQVFHGTALAAAYGESPENKPYMYIIQHGTPSALSIVNLTTGKTEKTYTLENSTSAWGIDVDADQNVWIGGTSGGHIYKYDPASKKLTDYGNKLKHSRDTSIQDLHAAGGRIYGSTAYNGTVFSYIPETGERKDYGQIIRGKEFAKSVYFDEEQESIFMGIGSKAELIRYNIRTKIRDRFLPWEYRMEKYVSDIQVAGEYLFAKLDPSPKVLVFNKNTLEWLDEFDSTSKTVSVKSPLEEAVYYTNNEELYAYYFKTQETVKMNVPLEGMNVINIDFVEMGTEDYPGYTLTGLLSNNGDYFTYNLETREFKIHQAKLAPLPVTLYTMGVTPDRDKIIINGYMSGGLGLFNIASGETEEVKGISQVESMAYLNDKLYFGAYPKARILEYDLTKPFEGQNINEIARYKDVGQERPTAMLGINETNQLFIGTYPETSTGGGLLSVYNPETKETINYENYIENQSIISLVKAGDHIYGGTSVYANHERAKSDAVLFRFPSDSPSDKEELNFPIKAAMINALTPYEENYIFGMADGKLFKYDIESGQTKQVMIVPAISGRFKNANLQFGKDHYLYGTVEGVLFKANPKTMEVTLIKKEGAHDLAIDQNGHIYFRNEADMWKYEPK
ncbi:hypothetical protein BK139_06685 [Paenibacillus sp. FSL R5-0490]|uniref:hypothetical protein n=1 Tax=Bacillales TaxID=1385 RepID=UPI00096DE2CD|nr:hypothetical protein [Paenibacillus sp. FSL R5-0490]OMF61522.1 hypothetical protein BK139_06685 [Paenibacillus sp. FSL R5-0490]